ncbi:hypothetical protein KY313_00075 [Candidatus Woesearchaeota archaeon]|nr:hypothetical protein [Candidatus Woesearchaeota archaeon]
MIKIEKEFSYGILGIVAIVAIVGLFTLSSSTTKVVETFEGEEPTSLVGEAFKGECGKSKLMTFIEKGGITKEKLISFANKNNCKKIIEGIKKEGRRSMPTCNFEIGDVDQNGGVYTTDLDALAGVILAGGYVNDAPCGDMNGDNVLNVVDIVRLVNVVNYFVMADEGTNCVAACGESTCVGELGQSWNDDMECSIMKGLGNPCNDGGYGCIQTTGIGAPFADNDGERCKYNAFPTSNCDTALEINRLCKCFRETPPSGCTDDESVNYDSNAEIDDGSCVFINTMWIDIPGVDQGKSVAIILQYEPGDFNNPDIPDFWYGLWAYDVSNGSNFEPPQDGEIPTTSFLQYESMTFDCGLQSSCSFPIISLVPSGEASQYPWPDNVIYILFIGGLQDAGSGYMYFEYGGDFQSIDSLILDQMEFDGFTYVLGNSENAGGDSIDCTETCEHPSVEETCVESAENVTDSFWNLIGEPWCNMMETWWGYNFTQILPGSQPSGVYPGILYFGDSNYCIYNDGTGGTPSCDATNPSIPQISRFCKCTLT